MTNLENLTSYMANLENLLLGDPDPDPDCSMGKLELVSHLDQ
jgi:hypothetical protein